MKLFKYSSFTVIAFVMFACKSLSEGQIETKQSGQEAQKETYSTASNGSSNGESRAKDTPSIMPAKGVSHASPDQARLDSLKQVKTNKKK